MKIPQGLPQFGDKKSLFIVTGIQTAEFYKVYKGELTELGRFKIDNPKYSDREGYFERRGFGKFFGGGSVSEDKKDKVVREFLKTLQDSTKQIVAKEKIIHIYFFSPQHVLEDVRAVLPKSVKRENQSSFRGNYTKTHPLDLVRELQGRGLRRLAKKQIQTITDEARKILERTKRIGK